MAGKFELFLDEESNVRFRMIGPDGTVLAVSRAYRDTKEAAAGVAAILECAGTGLISNLCPDVRKYVNVKAKSRGIESTRPRPAISVTDAMSLTHAKAGVPRSVYAA